jgi:glycosyltransferase involved in cell wall biosynthesis
MNILMLATATPNSSLTHRPAALGHELVRRGHTVTMIAPSSDKHSGWKLDKPTNMGGIRMLYPWQLRTKSASLNLLPYIVGAALTVLWQRADVIYFSKPTPATIVGLLGKWRRGTPVVLDMDDLGAEVMKNEGQPALMWRLVMACERLAARQANGIVGASRLLVRLYQAIYQNKPVLRLPNGVDPSEFTPAAAPDGRRPRIIFFGVLNQTQVLGPVLEALPQVIAAMGRDNVMVEILGDGRSRGELEAQAHKLGLSANVIFRGWTTFGQLPQYVSAGDIALSVMPESHTTAACSNQKVFQYMAMGLCPVVSDVGDLPLYVESGQAGLVVPAGDRPAIAQAIVSLLMQPDKRAKLSQRGRELAQTRYAWSTLATQLEQFLQGVVK